MATVKGILGDLNALEGMILKCIIKKLVVGIYTNFT
jgi:hypothetical protein